MEKTIIKMTIEQWRLICLLKKVISKMAIQEATRYKNQLRYFEKSLNDILEEADMNIVDLTNEKYDIGMAADAINLNDFEENDILVVEQMIEPLIMQNKKIKKQALVILKKVDR